MSQFKKAKVVMLPTNQKAPIIKRGHLLSTYDTGDGDGTYQHLYILTDDEVDIGEWIMTVDFGPTEVSHKVKVALSDGHSLYRNSKKIIATTNPYVKITHSNSVLNKNGSYDYTYSESPLPTPSDSFIEKYVTARNEYKVIEEVSVEYKMTHNPDGSYHLKPKVNLGNNITIRKTKNSWDVDEVKNLIHRAFDLGFDTRDKKIKDLDEIGQVAENFIKNNL